MKTAFVPLVGVLITSFVNLASAAEGGSVCPQQMAQISQLIVAKERGATREEALRMANDISVLDSLRAEFVGNVFDHKNLNRGAIMMYEVWSCQARSTGATPRPLNEVEADLQLCQALSGRAAMECTAKVRAKVLGGESEDLPAPQLVPRQAVSR